jgi:hypothetical protein
VKFTAKEEDDEDDADATLSAKPPSSDASTCAPAPDAAEVADSEEARLSSSSDSEEPLQQSLKKQEAAESTGTQEESPAEPDTPPPQECQCGGSFGPRSKFCTSCGTSREKAEAILEERAAQLRKEQGQQADDAEVDESVDPDHECENLWETCIKPQIADIITWSLLSVVDCITHRKGSYELYGYDFMLSPGVDGRPKVWLIEVNSSPACDYSTPVTTPLVKKMMDDTVKVMVDKRSDPDCDTGEWELHNHQFAKHVSMRVANFNLDKLEVSGTQIKPPKSFAKKKKSKTGQGKSGKAAVLSASGDSSSRGGDDCADGDPEGGDGEEEV